MNNIHFKVKLYSPDVYLYKTWSFDLYVDIYSYERDLNTLFAVSTLYQTFRINMCINREELCVYDCFGTIICPGITVGARSKVYQPRVDFYFYSGDYGEGGVIFTFSPNPANCNFETRRARRDHSRLGFRRWLGNWYKYYKLWVSFDVEFVQEVCYQRTW